MAPSIMGNLPHDIIRQIILESTREERSRKDALDYWTRNMYDHPRGHFARLRSLYDVHNQMKQVTRLEKDACHMSALPLPGSPQADEGTGIMWRRVWWSRHHVRPQGAVGAAAFFNVPWDEWHSLLKDRRQKEKEAIAVKELCAREWTYKQHLKFQRQSGIHYDPSGEFLLAQHD
jgi:hypothetical protein